MAGIKIILNIFKKRLLCVSFMTRGSGTGGQSRFLCRRRTAPEHDALKNIFNCKKAGRKVHWSDRTPAGLRFCREDHHWSFPHSGNIAKKLPCSPKELLDASFIGRRWPAPAQMTCTGTVRLQRKRFCAGEARKSADPHGFRGILLSKGKMRPIFLRMNTAIT